MARVLRLLLSAATAISLMTFGSGTAFAQAGTICRTPYFDCQANPPGAPNTVCFCPTGNGWVQGVLV